MIYGIGDLHLDNTKTKPMDIFGSLWINHEEKIFSNWKKVVSNEDVVLIPGDISWAMNIEEAYFDLKKIDLLPGKKVITKGNHDYWWESKRKLNSLELKSIFFLQNESFDFNKVSISGTRGWISKDSEGFDSHDEKIFSRELNRLNLSLSQKKENIDKRIVMLHYPPFNMDLTPNEFVSLMKEKKVDLCIYGHLHGEGHRYVVEGLIEGIEFLCVSSDYLNFCPKKLM